jgi:hypothetical protein
MWEWFGKLVIIFLFLKIYLWVFGVNATNAQIIIYTYLLYEIFQESLE